MNDHRPNLASRSSKHASRASAHVLVSAASAGIAFAIVVSGGILGQRLWGTTPARALLADVATTLAALALARGAVARSPNRDGAGVAHASVAARVLQALGGCVGVLTMHALLAFVAPPPWIVERPAQLVNDLVAVFGILAFVWSTSDRALFSRDRSATRRLLPTPHLAIGALAIVLLYELTATAWHFDASPTASGVRAAWSIQRFVGTEVTASGLGILVFRALVV